MTRLFPLRVRERVDILLLAAVSFLPTVLVSDGTYNADTKLYLTTNVGRLMARSRYAWDPSQFAGYVQHQAVGYLWPMGPFYWLCNASRLPPWFAQRLWVATLFFVASCGVRGLLRHFNMSSKAALVAALAYQFSPYVLAYQSRTSAMLLPWCGLPWIVLAVDRGLRSRSWREPALIALIVATIGGINATSLLMIAVAPMLQIVSYWRENRDKSAIIARFVSVTTGLCFLSSAWWISMVLIQSRYGADVLTYSETVQAVSSTSTSAEVFRGLGYWLNYITTATHPTTTRAILYMRSDLMLAVSLVVPFIGVIGLLVVRSGLRRIAAWWLTAGVIISVGVHPLTDSSPLTRVFSSHPDSFISLALRSSTRAIPVVSLAVAVGIAALYTEIESRISRCGRRTTSASWGLFLLCSCLTVAVVPSRLTHGVSDSALNHSGLPDYWKKTGEELSRKLGKDSRVVQLPGQEFGAYSWGYTVDPALPAVTSTPVLTRDLLPLGSSQNMDLINSIDDTAREGALDMGSARRLLSRLGAGALVIPHDLDVDRFGTYDSEKLQTEMGPGQWTTYGLGKNSIATFFEPRASLARLDSGFAIVEGSGRGLVNLARSSIGLPMTQFSSDLSDNQLSASLDEGTPLIVTDTNRYEARQWRGSLDTIGYSEDGPRGQRMSVDSADRRLPLFDKDPAQGHTIVRQTSRMTARSSSYGYALGYWPEARAAYAVDGRPETSWTTGAYSSAIGQYIVLSGQVPERDLLLLQPKGARHISMVAIKLNDETTWTEVTLTQQSLTTGQRIRLRTPATEITVRIDQVSSANGPLAAASNGVGFAEMLPHSGISDEETVVPTRAVSLSPSGTLPIFVFSRLVAPNQSWWRSDPERRLARTFQTPTRGAYEIEGRGSLDISVESSVASLIGVPSYSVGQLSESYQHAGWNATDRNPFTSWRTRFGQIGPTELVISVVSPTPQLTINQCDSPECNRITAIRVTDETGTSVLRTVDDYGVVETAGLKTGRWSLRIEGTTARTQRESRFGTVVTLPTEVFEIAGRGVETAVPANAMSLGSLLSLDQKTIGKVSRVDLSLAGTFSFSFTEQISRGVHRLAGKGDLLRIDDVVLYPAKMTPFDSFSYTPVSMSGTPVRRVLTVPPRMSQRWLTIAEGFSDGWKLEVDGVEIPQHRKVDGGFNSWLLPVSAKQSTATLTFVPQKYADISQVVSLATAIACLLLLLRSRQHKSAPCKATVRGVPVLRLKLRQRIAASCLLVLVSGLLVSPSMIPLALLLSLGLLVARRGLQIVVFPLLVVGYIIVRLIVRVAATNPVPDFDWPSVTEFVHRPLLVGLLLAAIVVTLTDDNGARN